MHIGQSPINGVLDAPKGDTNYFSNLEGHTDSEFVGLSGEYAFTPDLNVYAGVGHIEKAYSGHIFGTRLVVGQADGHATSQYYRTGSLRVNYGQQIQVFNISLIRVL